MAKGKHMADDEPVRTSRTQDQPEGGEIFHALAEAAPDAVVLVSPADVICYANPALLRKFGYSRDELLGRRLSILQPERLRRFHDDSVRRFRDQRVRTVNWHAFETTAIQRDGTEFPAEISFAEVPVGGQVYLAGFIRDITRRREQKQRLEETERRLDSILGAMKDVVWSTTPEGQWLYINPAVQDLFGRSVEEMRANPKLWFQITHPEDRAVAAAIPLEIMQKGAIDVEYRILRPDGQCRCIRSRGRAIRDEQGRIVRLDGIVTDITEAKEYREHILRLSRIQAVLSGINALTVRERNRHKLLEGVCRIAVEQGQLRMVWIGFLQPDGSIRPAASYGADEGYLEAISGTYLSANRTQLGPAHRAIGEKRPIVVNDLTADDSLTPVREAALARGFHGVAVMPLWMQGKAIGCLALYSSEAGFFDEDEMGLLTQLAGDVAYALEFIEREEQLRFASSYDALTGLANRRLFLDRIDQFIENGRQRQRKLAVLLIDLARFKSINDAVGPVAADEVLKQAAERLLRFAGNATYVGRVGGDRFGAMLPDIEDATAVARLLQDKVWERLGRTILVDGHDVHPTARVGVALFPDDGDNAAAVFRNAEAAVKRAKESNQRFVFYTPEMTHSIKARLTLETQMRHALEREQFVLHYQPKVDLRTGAICGAEALIRWNDPRNGLVPPSQFIPTLEESGLIVEVGRWALQKAAEDRRAWLAAHLPPLPIAVNVSAVQLRQTDFVPTVLRAMETADGPGTGLEIEVTESSLMSNVDLSVDQLKTLRANSVPCAIDDFGTGYSSLAYLARLPINAVKVDRSFVVSMTDNADTMAIVSAIIALAHSMNLKVVAEGVDTTEQLKFLRLMRCDELQGFLFSRGVPSAEFVELVRSGRRLE
jgi:diguanylate cyclase (GGDEF)-like protein/PAS domain S-box-containing protein